MKRTLHMLALLFISLSIFAQAPQKMSYQAVIRNSSNNLVTNASVKMRISILQGSATGSSVYSELHSATTNANGLVSIEIGAGTSPIGNFSTINWGDGTYFLKTETDPNNGNNYTITGTSQFLSVPYALFANCIPMFVKGDTLTIGCRQFVIPSVKDITPPSTLNFGLVGHWPITGNANDISGNNNHGNVKGATLSTDRYGRQNSSYYFRGFGNNDHIKVPNSPSLQFSNSMSISLWYKAVPGNGMDGNGNFSPWGSYCLFAKEGDGIGTPPGFYGEIVYTPLGGNLGYYNTNGCCDARNKQDSLSAYSYFIQDTTPKWQHLVIVASNTNFKIYINGVLVKTKSLDQNFIGANSRNLFFGIFGFGDSQDPLWYPLKGWMDDIRMYNRPLLQEEITYLANN